MSTRFDLSIVNSPICYPNEAIFLDHDIQTLKTLCGKLLVLTGNFPNRYGDTVQVIEVEQGKAQAPPRSILQRILHQLITQLKLALQIIRFRTSMDIVLFNLGEYHNVLPLLTAKLLGKTTVVFQHGGDKILESKIVYSEGVNRLIVPIEASLLKMTYALVDHILCQSPSIVKFGRLQKYEHKIVFWPGCYIDIERFTPRKKPEERENLVGYSGRLSPVKGVVNLIRAIPLVIEKRPDVRFIVSGIGPEHQRIQAVIDELGVRDFINLTPWIPDDEFVDFLNQIKVFALPSYEEGIPQVIREAMVSGVIVLTTPVGGLPDLVKDCETGFIMPDNTPECVAQNILRTLDYPDLASIATAARNTVVRESSFNAVRDKWHGIIKYLSSVGDWK